MNSSLKADIVKAYRDGPHIEARGLTVPLDRYHVAVLYGPSGAGKTTILRCLAGLEKISAGSIRGADEVWDDPVTGVFRKPQQRPIGFLHQDYALFPRMSAEENIAYSLINMTKRQRQERVAELLELFQIKDLARKRPAKVSGGQKQRIALARAVANHPQLLLLDEPLSALDNPTRQQLLGQISEFFRRLELSVILVTHDWTEALALAHQILVISEGRLLQTGVPDEVFSRPANLDVASAVGVETVVTGQRVGRVGELIELRVGDVTLWVVDRGTNSENVYVCIRASDVTLEIGGAVRSSARNHLRGKVVQVVSVGTVYRVAVDVGFPLSAFITGASIQELELKPGRQVTAVVKASAIHLIPRSTSRGPNPTSYVA